jgi:hypothetical protein
MKNANILLYAALIILFPLSASAFYYGGGKSLGLAGAYTAVSDDTCAVYMNPAGLAQTKSYTVEINHETNKIPGSKLWGITLVDSQASSLAAGLAYYKETRDFYPALSDSEEMFVLALAEQFKSNLFFGISYKYIKQRHHTRDDQTWDAGMILRLTPQLKMAFTGKNLSSTKMDEIHKLYTAGLAYTAPNGLGLSYDITKDEDTIAEEDITYSVGVDVMAMSAINFRGGYMVDKIQDKKFYSLNIAYVGQGFSFGYAFMRDEDDSNDIIHNFSIKIN